MKQKRSVSYKKWRSEIHEHLKKRVTIITDFDFVPMERNEICSNQHNGATFFEILKRFKSSLNFSFIIFQRC